MTGNSIYDAIGSISIGLLLGCTALFLISQNRSLLIGEAFANAMQRFQQHRADAIMRIFVIVANNT